MTLLSHIVSSINCYVGKDKMNSHIIKYTIKSLVCCKFALSYIIEKSTWYLDWTPTIGVLKRFQGFTVNIISKLPLGL